jgi:hypothetical protein
VKTYKRVRDLIREVCLIVLPEGMSLNKFKIQLAGLACLTVFVSKSPTQLIDFRLHVKTAFLPFFHTDSGYL